MTFGTSPHHPHGMNGGSTQLSSQIAAEPGQLGPSECCAPRPRTIELTGAPSNPRASATGRVDSSAVAASRPRGDGGSRGSPEGLPPREARLACGPRPARDACDEPACDRRGQYRDESDTAEHDECSHRRCRRRSSGRRRRSPPSSPFVRPTTARGRPRESSWGSVSSYQQARDDRDQARHHSDERGRLARLLRTPAEPAIDPTVEGGPVYPSRVRLS